MKKITDIVWELAEPAVQEQGCRIWDVEYVREAGQWYLRLYLDKDGGVTYWTVRLSAGRSAICWTRPTPSRAAMCSRGAPPDWSGS